MILLRALITGISGFAGSHLAEYLLGRNDIEVFGISRSGHATPNIDHLRPHLHLFDGDLNDFETVHSIVQAIRPTLVFHLAAQSAVPYSWENPGETLSNNIISQLNILEAAAKSGAETRVLVIG